MWPNRMLLSSHREPSCNKRVRKPPIFQGLLPRKSKIAPYPNKTEEQKTTKTPCCQRGCCCQKNKIIPYQDKSEEHKKHKHHVVKQYVVAKKIKIAPYIKTNQKSRKQQNTMLSNSMLLPKKSKIAPYQDKLGELHLLHHKHLFLHHQRISSEKEIDHQNYFECIMIKTVFFRAICCRIGY